MEPSLDPGPSASSSLPQSPKLDMHQIMQQIDQWPMAARVILGVPKGKGIEVIGTQDEMGIPMETEDSTLHIMKQRSVDFGFMITLDTAGIRCFFIYVPGRPHLIIHNISLRSVTLENPVAEHSLTVGPLEQLDVCIDEWCLKLPSNISIDVLILGAATPSVWGPLTGPTIATGGLALGVSEDFQQYLATDHAMVPSPMQFIDFPEDRLLGIYDVSTDQDRDQDRFYSTIKKGRLSAQSSDSEVFLAGDSRFSNNIAVKAVKIPSTGAFATIKSLEMLQNEVNIHGILKHPRIVEMLGFDARLSCIYLRYVAGTDLTKWSDAEGFCTISQSNGAQIWIQTALALEFVHRSGLVHNDIKPGNIIVRQRQDQHMDAYLCDFGLSSHTGDKAHSRGTPFYVPPEWLERNSRDKPGDIWALGIVMLYVLHLITLPDLRGNTSHPQHKYWWIDQVHDNSNGDAEIMQSWITEICTLIETSTSPGAPLLKRMLRKEPETRCSIDLVVHCLSQMWVRAGGSLEHITNRT